MKIEVVYARPRAAEVVTVMVEQGATLRDAIERSGLLARHPEIDLARNRVGVFGAARRLEEAVRSGDRVEIYRPLTADPKEQRRRRARRR